MLLLFSVGATAVWAALTDTSEPLVRSRHIDAEENSLKNLVPGCQDDVLGFVVSMNVAQIGTTHSRKLEDIMVTITTRQESQHLDTPVVRTGTRELLTAAALAGPFFYISSAIQALTREGFDLRIHPLSQLATGGPGWVQQLTFVLAGLGVLALAVAHRRLVTTGAGSRIAPIFLSIFGVGFVAAGCFPMDAQNGFPLGAPVGLVEMSWHSIVHTSAAAASFIALAGACIALLVRSIRRRRVWASIGNGLVALMLLLPMSPTESSIQVAVTGLIAFTWVTVSALRLQSRA